MADVDNQESGEKKIVMSLSVLPDVRDTLRESARRSGKSVSGLVSELIQKHLHLVVSDGTEISVILKIPQQLKGDKDRLKSWLDSRTEGILSRLS